MKVRTRVVTAIGAISMAALVGVSAPAYASVNTQPTAAVSTAVSTRTIMASQWYVAYTYPNTRWGWLGCTAAGVGLKLAGQVSAWYCAVDEQSGALFLWVLA